MPGHIKLIGSPNSNNYLNNSSVVKTGGKKRWHNFENAGDSNYQTQQSNSINNYGSPQNSNLNSISRPNINNTYDGSKNANYNTTTHD